MAHLEGTVSAFGESWTKPYWGLVFMLASVIYLRWLLETLPCVYGREDVERFTKPH